MEGLVNRLLAGARLGRERIAGGGDDAGAAEVGLEGRAAGAGGLTVELGELGRGGDARGAEQAEDRRRDRDLRLRERLADERASEPAAAWLVERSEPLGECSVVAVEPAAGELCRCGDHVVPRLLGAGSIPP